MCFNPRALTSPDSFSKSKRVPKMVSIHGLLRALTESLPVIRIHIDVSIHGLLRALTDILQIMEHLRIVSIHGLLRALTFTTLRTVIYYKCFNPRALTSPDRQRSLLHCFKIVSIHGLLRALTGETPELPWAQFVSIHGLLRALTNFAVFSIS